MKKHLYWIFYLSEKVTRAVITTPTVTVQLNNFKILSFFDDEDIFKGDVFLLEFN
jgi:hypothetical protein